jgi:hypothetical protein
LKRVPLEVEIVQEKDKQVLSQMDEKSRAKTNTLGMLGNVGSRHYERVVKQLNDELNIKTLPATIASFERVTDEAELVKMLSKLDDTIEHLQAIEDSMYEAFARPRRAMEKVSEAPPNLGVLFSYRHGPLAQLRGQPSLDFILGLYLDYHKVPSVAKQIAEAAIKHMERPSLFVDFTTGKFKLTFILLLTDKDTHLPLIEALINKGAPAPNGDWRVFLENAKDQKFSKEFIELLQKQVVKQELALSGPKTSDPGTSSPQ